MGRPANLPEVLNLREVGRRYCHFRVRARRKIIKAGAKHLPAMFRRPATRC